MPRHGTMRWAWGAAAAILLAAAGMVFAAALPVPPDFAYPKGANSPGAVTFSHKKHADAKVTNCMDCHAPGKFQMKKGATAAADLTMAAMNAGKSCGTCHNGQKSFSTKDAPNCTKCHKAG